MDNVLIQFMHVTNTVLQIEEYVMKIITRSNQNGGATSKSVV